MILKKLFLNYLIKRIRIEPMSRANTSNVIQQTCDKFEIELVDETADAIVDTITEERGRVQLTYLAGFFGQIASECF